MQTFTTIIAALVAGTALAAPTPYQQSSNIDHLVKVSHLPNTKNNSSPN
jgi:K+/H+ antiporter YhaU regulatory subunit KhtT